MEDRDTDLTPAAARWLLVATTAFVALGALPVGVAFVTHPDGSTLGMPVSLLLGTPFRDFAIPGAVLAVVVGGSHVAAAVLLGLGREVGWRAALVAGAVLAGWILVQVWLIGYLSWLQPFMGAIAAFELGVARRRR